MHRLAITRIEKNHKNYIAYILLDENRKICDLQVFEPEEETLLNNIYVGYVEKVVPNIQAAFVRIANGQKGYLPLKDLRAPVFTHKQSEKKQISEGDELLVQVTRDAVKTKDAVVSTKLVLHGHYCFLSSENTTLGVSKKIPQERAQEMIALANVYCKDHEAEGYGLVFRTNAQNVSEEELKETTDTLTEVFKNALGKDNLDVKVEKLKDENIASMAVLSEESRRMEEMMKMYGMGGMDTGMFGGQASLILNADHPLVQYVVENKEGENVELICKQLYDLALLAHKPLSPQEMTAFVQRSNQIMMLLTK